MDDFGPLSLLFRAFSDGDYALFAGGVVTTVVAALRALGLTQIIDKAWLKWIAMGIAVVTGVALGIVAQTPWLKILSTSINVGWCAIAAWETVIEPVRHRMRDARAAKTMAAVAAAVPATPALKHLVDDIDDPEKRGS